MARPRKTKEVPADDKQTRNLMEKIVKIIDDKHGSDIQVIDVSGITSLCRYFIICSGESSVQLRAMAEEIQYKLKHEEKQKPISLEGFPDSGWILLDYIDVIVHIFDRELRDFYRLERLWGQGIFIDVKEIIPSNRP